LEKSSPLLSELAISFKLADVESSRCKYFWGVSNLRKIPDEPFANRVNVTTH
jgi:hypothetical protein